jgi:DNA-binding CsgD family transcriptional regulator
VIVEGPLGIGKSRLLDEAREMATRRRLDVLNARGGELEQLYPWGVILQLFEDCLEGFDEETRAAAFRGRAALAEGLIFGSPSGDDALIGPEREFALVHALYWLVVNLSESRPLALVVDDLHWVDESSLRFLLYLAERLEDLPVLVIGAVRTPMHPATGDFVARLIEASDYPPLQPAELSLNATQRLLAQAGVAAAGHPDAVAACHRATGGSPLLVRELIVEMLQDPALTDATDSATIERAAPRSLESRILPRITGAGTHALAVARAAALIGDAPLAAVAVVSGTTLDEAVWAAARMMDASVLSQADPPMFAHPMMRSVVVAAIPPGERLRLHAACATALHDQGAPPEQIARHLIQGAPVVAAWAADALRDAARAAASRGVPQTAIAYLEHGIGNMPEGEARATMLVDLGLLEAATGQTASLERFEVALRVLTDERQQHRALDALGQTLYRYGRHQEAVTTFRRGADLFAESDPSAALHFEAAWALAAAHFATQGPSARRRLTQLARGIPTEQELTDPQRALLAAFSLHSAIGNPPAAAAATLANAALEGDLLVHSQAFGGVPASQAAVALLLTERFDEAERTLELLLEDAQRRDDALAFAGGSMVRAHVRLAQGRIVEAIADAEAALEGAAFGWGDSPQYVQVALATCLLERGELARAEELMSAADADEGSGLVADALRLGARARLRLARGDLDGALQDCDANRIALEAAGISNPNLGTWRPTVAAARHRSGDLEGARVAIDEELELAERWQLPNRIGAALRGRAALRTGAEARADLEASLAALHPDGTPLEQARTHFELGRLMQLDGDLDAARDELRRAFSIAHQCGALVLERDARQALVSAGGRPRRPAMDGVEALTPSERRIAELAAAGESNRAIAEALFLTKNTIEWHMRNVFKKLEVRSRNELRDRLAAVDAAGERVSEGS